MTTTRRPALCICCKTSRVSKFFRDLDLCTLCADWSGDENSHSDDGHAEGEFPADCLVCAHPEVKGCAHDVKAPKADRKPSAPTGRANTSHADHTWHAPNSAARARCREGRLTAVEAATAAKVLKARRSA